MHKQTHYVRPDSFSQVPYEHDRVLSLQDIEALAIGTWILGTGGGGSPYLNLLNMRKLYQENHRITLTDPLFLPDNALVAVVSTQGAPIVGQERLSNPAMSVKPLRILEEYLGRKFDAVMALEIGGGNGLLPLMISAMTGIPVVDADCMGRAYPEAQMTSFSVANLACFPLAMADIRDNEVLIKRAENWQWVERISRNICVQFGSTATTCKAPRSGVEVKNFGVLHTTSEAIRLGQAVLEAREQHADPVKAIIDNSHGRLIFTGKVTGIERRTTEGFLKGQAQLEGLDAHQGSQFILDFQNEFSVGWQDADPVVMTPDLICVVASETGEGIATETMRYGQRVTVLALPAAPIFLTENGLRLVGPRAFGFDFDYRSVFEEK